jgi:hypothetical protein
MKIGIVEVKYNKKNRWIYYIVIPILLPALFPLFFMFIPEIITTFVLYGIACILSLVFIDKVIDGIIFKGEIQINENELIICFNEQETTIPFNQIKLIILKPILGMSRVEYTFKVYDCQIKAEKEYHFNVTRAAFENGKIISRNLINPKAFDLIRFLEQKQMNYRIEKR